MAFIDSCWFTATSDGVANFSDGTALAGFRNLAGAGAVNGATYSYRAEALDRLQWEIGTGVYASAGGTLSRTVTASSTGAKINFVIPPIVSLQPMKADLDAKANAADLGTAASRNVGTGAGTVAAGDDSRITGALQSSSVASSADYRAATADKLLDADGVWAAADLAVLTDNPTIAVDLAAGFHFGGAGNAPLGIGGSRTLGAPSNVGKNQAGILWFAASGATRTLTLNAAWLLATGVEAGPYSITTSQELGIAYVVRGSTVLVTAILRRG